MPACASSVRNVYSGWRIARSTMTRSARTRSPGLTETQYSTGPGSACSRFMW